MSLQAANKFRDTNHGEHHVCLVCGGDTTHKSQVCRVCARPIPEEENDIVIGVFAGQYLDEWTKEPGDMKTDSFAR